MSPEIERADALGASSEDLVVPTNFNGQHRGEEEASLSETVDVSSSAHSGSEEISHLSFSSRMSDVSNFSNMTDSKSSLMTPRIRQLKLRSKMRLSRVKELLDHSQSDDSSAISIKEKRSMGKELRNLKKAINTLEGKYTVAHDKNEELLDRNRELESALRQVREDKKKVDQKYRGVKRLMRTLEKDSLELETMLKNTASLPQQLEDMEQEMESMRCELFNKQSVLEHQTARLVHLSSSLEESKDREFTIKSELESENIELRDQLAHVEHTAAQEKNELIEEMKRFKSLAGSLQEENARLASELKEANEKLLQSANQTPGLVGEFINVSERSKLTSPPNRSDSVFSVSTLDSTDRHYLERLEDVMVPMDNPFNRDRETEHDNLSQESGESQDDKHTGEDDEPAKEASEETRKTKEKKSKNRRKSGKVKKRRSSGASTSSGPDAYFDADAIEPGSHVLTPHTAEQSDFLSDAVERRRSFFGSLFRAKPERSKSQRLLVEDTGDGGFTVAEIEDEKEQSDFVREVTRRRSSRNLSFLGRGS